MVFSVRCQTEHGGRLHIHHCITDKYFMNATLCGLNKQIVIIIYGNT